jgi:hypothetical protein
MVVKCYSIECRVTKYHLNISASKFGVISRYLHVEKDDFAKMNQTKIISKMLTMSFQFYEEKCFQEFNLIEMILDQHLLNKIFSLIDSVCHLQQALKVKSKYFQMRLGASHRHFTPDVINLQT